MDSMQQPGHEPDIERQSPPEIAVDELNEVAEPNIFDRLGHLGMEWSQKPSAKIKHRLGAAIGLIGLGFFLKPQALEVVDLLSKDPAIRETVAGNKANFTRAMTETLHNPITVNLVETASHRSHAVSDSERAPSADWSAINPKRERWLEGWQREKDLDGIFRVGGATIQLAPLRTFFPNNAQVRDQGPAIFPREPTLVNLLKPDYQSVLPPAEPQAFRDWVRFKIEAYFSALTSDGTDYDPRPKEQQAFAAGDVNQLLEMAHNIVMESLRYDERSASWIGSEAGRMTYQWGKLDDIPGAVLSTDGLPVDQLLQQEHRGVCRQYAEAFARVVETMQQLYPDRWQNIHVVPVTSGFKFHRFTVVFQVKNDQLVQMSVFDPLDSRDSRHFNPAFELLKMLYYRNIITDEMFFTRGKEYFLSGGDTQIVDVTNFLELALHQRTPESLKAARQVLAFHLLLPSKIEKRAEDRSDIEMVQRYRERLVGYLAPYVDRLKKIDSESPAEQPALASFFESVAPVRRFSSPDLPETDEKPEGRD